MNILLIGNGFDLAHGLPTEYSQCLKFFNCCSDIFKGNFPQGFNTYKTHVINEAELPNELKDFLIALPQTKEADYNVQTLSKLLDKNFWLHYFNWHKMRTGAGWIDFESTISSIIKIFNKDWSANGNRGLNRANIITNSILAKYASDYWINDKTTDIYSEIHLQLLNDLNNLIHCLEIYLSICLQFLPIKNRLQDILNIDRIDSVLSFNYTNTFEKIYGVTSTQYCYIHGKIRLFDEATENNMVLGIDEYLSAEERDFDSKCIQFKKYYQRILKQTDYNYTSWLNIRTKDKATITLPSLPISVNVPPPFHSLYIFGHSLDVTDADVLRKLILHDYMRTTIFYRSEEENGKQITNLVKILGYEKVNECTRGGTPPIVFQKIHEDKQLS